MNGEVSCQWVYAKDLIDDQEIHRRFARLELQPQLGQRVTQGIASVVEQAQDLRRQKHRPSSTAARISRVW